MGLVVRKVPVSKRGAGPPQRAHGWFTTLRVATRGATENFV